MYDEIDLSAADVVSLRAFSFASRKTLFDNRNKFIIFSSKGNQVSAQTENRLREAQKIKNSINSNLGKVSCILSAAAATSWENYAEQNFAWSEIFALPWSER
jgi:hypothetical protein